MLIPARQGKACALPPDAVRGEQETETQNQSRFKEFPRN